MPGAYIPNPNFENELDTTDALAEAAEQARAKAEPMVSRIMPRNAEALEVQTDGDEVALVNTDHGGHIDEWGSVNSPPHAPLRRGVRAAGFRLTEESR